MPEPFVAYLRVYEPLSSYDSPLREELAAVVERGPVDPFEAGLREQDVWLRSQLAAPPRLLPGETADGAVQGVGDVLVLDPADVPSAPAAKVGPGPLVCPLDLRGRSAAALVGFLGDAEIALRSAVLQVPVEKAKVRASAVVSELAGGAVHVLSSTWTVPLPWFVLVDPVERCVFTEPGRRRVCWRVAMADARRRVARAHAIGRQSIGEEGPTRILHETGRWLERFHPHSAVELDYGGLVQLMTASDLDADTSAEDVHAIVDAMEADDAEEVGTRYESLRDFWGEFAARERHN
ncbi:hypothetical protein BJ970_002061 [Saccharopolyspora phatthalungensis]|uniref:DUF8083 domain-containing protein n=1 Tax=Saccharopolyspora phatthalungensis TaxID=664693 RepID=A0A840Q3G7_9PSEU|nr:hypothetical protein [Saccharopolyspora phatthalungensis]MBB5154527.1 hypothetical protein [Saccharopolyspora phatthalungensis]